METQQINNNIKKEPTFNELYSYGHLPEKYNFIEYESRTKLKNPYSFIHKTALIGIEIEIENINSTISEYLSDVYWNVKEDSSLRNNGLEFITKPIRAKQIPYAMEYFIDTIHKYSPNYSFTNRCSLHIHLNVRDFTPTRLKIFILLYSLFEKHFFKIAGTKRESSLFCVPLYKTDQLNSLLIDNFWTHWKKYSALNLCPIVGGDGSSRIGTIEFRHLYGTLNTEIIYNWINNILCLRKACYNWDFFQLEELILKLNTTSEYFIIYKQIFGNLCFSLTKHDFESCISNLKTALWGPFGLKQYPFSENSYFHSKYAINKPPPLTLKIPKNPSVSALYDILNPFDPLDSSFISTNQITVSSN